jgi:hypothetical protein
LESIFALSPAASRIFGASIAGQKLAAALYHRTIHASSQSHVQPLTFTLFSYWLGISSVESLAPSTVSTQTKTIKLKASD